MVSEEDCCDVGWEEPFEGGGARQMQKAAIKTIEGQGARRTRKSKDIAS